MAGQRCNEAIAHAPRAPAGIEGELMPPAQFEILQGSSISPQVAEALRQAHKMAAVGQMPGGLAHDFNNLLQGVVGALDVVQRRIDQGRTEELAYPLDAALKSLNRAAALTHRLLAFSRPHALDLEPVDINAVIASMEALLTSALGDRIELDLVLIEALPPTMCDPHQLENAVLNLAINARDAMPHGGRVMIETFCAEPGERAGQPRGRYVGVRVADTGVGMTPYVAARAFDPFYTTKSPGRGTGLGLAMIRHFVEQFRGSVSVESAVGEGTSVTLYLPCHGGRGQVCDAIEYGDRRAQ